VYAHLFTVKGLQSSILRHIAHAATIPVVKHVINAVIPLLSDLKDDNVLERLQKLVNALDEASALIYGRENRLIYAEFYRLFTIDRINDIASYQCLLHSNQFTANNQLAQITLGIFNKLGSISRTLRIYLKREGVQDRLSSLLETIEVIDKTNKYLDRQYSIALLGEPIAKLPNYTLFQLLLEKWREMVVAQLNELRGKAEIQAELQTKCAHNEDRVGVWLSVRNIGRSSADDVKITLLHNKNIDVIGSNSFETESIPPEEETTAEFIIRPYATTVDLVFEIVYEDADKIVKIEQFADRLELRESHQEFHYIPNQYSTGTPTQDSKMFYGREEDMAFLRNNLTRDAKTVIVLYGQRRSGKTTLLLQLMNGTALNEHIPVLIDMQRVSYNITINNLLHRMAYSIAQAMKKKHLLVRQPELDDFQIDPTHTFDIFLDNVEEHLAEQRLILLIDEFEVLEEQVVKGRLHPEIFEYLRDIIQHRQSVNCLFSGTHKITKFTKWYRSTFFNIARHHRLSKLSSQGAEDLIQKPVAGYLEYEPLTVKKIRQLTADQPYLLHLMCRSIVDYCNDRRKTYVTINDVNTVLREVMQTGQFHFDWLWDQIAPEERVALSAIAEAAKEEGRWLSLVEIEEIFRRWHIPYKREYLQTSLKTLMDADIIESISNDSKSNALDGIRFRIPVGLTRGWLLKERPLELVLKEMSS
ncbi:MAG TPA: ATP-binding protein, partial [Ktedonobacteraceae bacterium]|nr:ATP-binding protein [Ktedonobacteraceae bacterium]